MPLGFAVLKTFLRVIFKLLLNIVFGEKEFAYCEKTCYAENACNIAECIIMVYDDLARNSYYKYLDCICRGEVDKHTYELKSYEYREHIFEEYVCGEKIRAYGEYLFNLKHDKRENEHKREHGYCILEKSYCRMKETI